MIRIHVHLFAILRDRAGISELTLQVPEGATVRSATNELTARYPALSGAVPRIAFAVNREYASPDVVLRDGDELALIPPVSGG